MRRIKKMMAVLTLAVMASLGAQTAFAGVYLSDRNGILLSDKTDATKTDNLALDVVVVVVNGLTGILLSD